MIEYFRSYQPFNSGKAGMWREMIDIEEMNTRESELAGFIVKTLNLDFDIENLDPNIPLYGEGFGLDSIDILEIALAVSQKYGVVLRSDNENNTQIFSSLRSLNKYIQEASST